MKIIDVKVLVNQIVHSLVFVLRVDGDDIVRGFQVMSTQGQGRGGLFDVSLADFCGLMREVGRDYPCTLKVLRDPVNRTRMSVRSCPIHPPVS